MHTAMMLAVAVKFADGGCPDHKLNYLYIFKMKKKSILDIDPELDSFISIGALSRS